MARSKRQFQIIVCDAGPLIHLDEIGCLDLLSNFSCVLIPEAVWQEVVYHRPSVFQQPFLSFEKAKIADEISAELEALKRLFALHSGEIEALQLAYETEFSILLTDDSAARLAAKNLSLPAHGTIGILLRAIRCHQRSRKEVIALLRSLPETSTLHIKPILLNEIIEEIKI